MTGLRVYSRTRHARPDAYIPSPVTGVYIRAPFKHRDGTLWVGCNQFLNKFDPKTETFTRYPVPFVNHISQDSAGMLWLATSTGLYASDRATGQIGRYSLDPNDLSSISSNVIALSGEDKAGRLLGCEYRGAFRRKTGTDASPIRVITVDDQALLREGISALINAVAAELAKHGAKADALEESTRTC
jgi:hypothetical protein